MLKPKSPQESFYGNYLYDRIVPVDHLLRKINQVVDFSFTEQIFKDRYNPVVGRPAEAPEFMLRLCLLQYIYGDSDRQVVENARLNLAYKYFLGLAVDAELPDYTTISYFRVQRLGEEKFRSVLEQIVKQCIDKGLVKGDRQIIDSTPIRANITLSSITGLARKCRENVLKTIAKQNTKTAEKLGLNDVRNAENVNFNSTEEVKPPVNCLIVLPMRSKGRGLVPPRNFGKTWNYWKRSSRIGDMMPRISFLARWILMLDWERKTAPPGRVTKHIS
jgi:transposase